MTILEKNLKLPNPIRVAGLVGKIGRDFVTFGPIQTCATTETANWGLYSNVIAQFLAGFFLLISHCQFVFQARKNVTFVILVIQDFITI